MVVLILILRVISIYFLYNCTSLQFSPTMDREVLFFPHHFALVVFDNSYLRGVNLFMCLCDSSLCLPCKMSIQALCPVSVELFAINILMLKNMISLYSLDINPLLHISFVPSLIQSRRFLVLFFYISFSVYAY